jgi:hypothetical protein
MFVDDLRAGADLMGSALAVADPSALDGAAAAEVVDVLCMVKRRCEAGIALFARRVEATGAYTQFGHRNAPEWLGEIAGEAPGRAKGRLEMAARSEKLPELDTALREGSVSGEQARVIAGAAAFNPEGVTELLETASTESFSTLSEKATAIRHRALSDEDVRARRVRVHRARHWRFAAQPTGGVGSRLFMPDEAWGSLFSVVEPVTERFFQEGRRNGNHESRDAYRVDALVWLLTAGRGSAGAGDAGEAADAVDVNGDSNDATTPPEQRISRGRPKAMVQLRVDVESLRRGYTEGDEVCEIAGVGPVPVAAARELLGDAIFELLVRKGCDLVNLTGHYRNVPQRLRTAVLRRDQHCRWPRCSETKGLEEHHWRIDCSKGELATMATLVALCYRHHALCTYGGWRIQPDGAGGYRPVPPLAPVGEPEIARRRRQAARAAKARVNRANGPPGQPP